MTVALSTVSEAHPAHLGQALVVDVRNDVIDLELTLSPGTMVAADLVRVIDRDGDRQISPQEQQALAQSIAQSLTVRLDSVQVQPRDLQVECPVAAIVETGQSAITWRAKIHTILSPGMHQFQLRNGYQPVQSAYMVNAFVNRGPAELLATDRTLEGQQVALSLRVRGKPKSNAGAMKLLAFCCAVTFGASVLSRVSQLRKVQQRKNNVSK